MTPELSHAAAGLADLAHTLESGDEPDIRLPRAVERIRLLLESDACACASTASPLAPSVVVAPSVPAAEEVRLGRDAVALLQVVLDRGERGARGASGRAGGGRPHLAMPLIALGEVVGTILVEREGEPTATRTSSSSPSPPRSSARTSRWCGRATPSAAARRPCPRRWPRRRPPTRTSPSS